MHVHLIDGTYELFRHYHAVPPARDRDAHALAQPARQLMRVLVHAALGVGHAH